MCEKKMENVRRTKSVTIITRSRSNAPNPFDVKLDADRHHNYLIVERCSRKLQNELKTSCSLVTLEKSCLETANKRRKKGIENSHSHNRQRQQWQDHRMGFYAFLNSRDIKTFPFRRPNSTCNWVLFAITLRWNRPNANERGNSNSSNISHRIPEREVNKMGGKIAV